VKVAYEVAALDRSGAGAHAIASTEDPAPVAPSGRAAIVKDLVARDDLLGACLASA